MELNLTIRIYRIKDFRKRNTRTWDVRDKNAIDVTVIEMQNTIYCIVYNRNISNHFVD